MHSDTPSRTVLRDIKEQQVNIIKELYASGYNYEQIASFFGVKSGAVLRHYISRKRAPRGDGTVLQEIHKQIMDERGKSRTILSSISIERYIAVCTGKKLSSISYQRKTEKPSSNTELGAISQIYHDIYQIDHNFSMSNLKRVRGRYYVYRNSTIEEIIVKSYLEINVSENGAFYAEFTHCHPDRFYNPSLNPSLRSEGRSLTRAPRRSHGLAFHLGINFYMFGSTENGQAVDIFALRDPMNIDFFSLSGYNLTTNLDRILFSARTILIKNDDATEKGIKRIRLSDFDPKSEGFDIHILENMPERYLCDNVSRMRMF
jgi:hypothetical protein